MPTVDQRVSEKNILIWLEIQMLVWDDLGVKEVSVYIKQVENIVWNGLIINFICLFF